MRAISKTCVCCGSDFKAGNDLAKWCSSRCSMRAYQRRRRGAPEADPGVCQVIRPTQAIQPELLSDPDELPPEWRDAQVLGCRAWNGTVIQRRESDGYVNATAMCQANGKRWGKFHESAQCQAYMQALAAEDRNSVFDLVVSQRGGSGAGGSTWIHPDLATELARWISPAFSVFINRWFRSELEARAAAAQLPPQPRPEPQLPQLPPSGPAILIRAKTPREAAQLWCDTLALAAAGAIRRNYSTLHRADTALPPCAHWQHLPA